MESRNEGVGPESQIFMQVPSSRANSNSKPPEGTVSGGVRPVLNYSIQTGEEFDLEFMRERATPRKTNTSGDQTTAYLDLNVVSRTESVSDATGTATGEKKQFKELEKKNFSEHENKVQYGSSHVHSSSSGGLKKMKMLCSFGGRILPRPIDGKLRYVGGDTRIIRISKDISWQELIQKAREIYNQTHTMKYQLPGEDFEALISVSSDEDLQNMMEECSVLEGSKGSQKLRIFLFTLGDFDGMHFGVGNMEGDSESLYVVAVNGTESTSAGDSDQLINLNVEVDRASAGFSRDHDTFFPQNHGIHYVEGGPAIYAPHENIQNFDSRISIPSYMPSDYGYNSQYSQVRDATVPMSRDLLLHHGVSEGKLTTDNFPQKQKNNEYIQSLENELTTLMQQDDGLASVTNAAHSYDSNVEHHHDTGEPFTSEFSEHEADMTDLGYKDPPLCPARAYHSEWIPREQTEFLNRLSKSNDSVASQNLINQSDAHVAQGSIAETVDHSDEGNPMSQIEKPSKAPNLPNSSQFEKYKELNDITPQINQYDDDSVLDHPISTVVDDVVMVKDNVIGPLDTGTEVERRGIDINNQFSVLFSEARLAEDSEILNPQQKDDPGLSLNKPQQKDDPGLSLNKHNHKWWSYFRNLAQDGKDVSLMDQDQIGYSPPLKKLEEGVPNLYAESEIYFDEEMQQKYEGNTDILGPGFITSQIARPPLVDKGGEGLVVENLYVKVGEDLRTPISECEVEFETEEIGRPTIDASLGDNDLNDLQLIMNEDLEELRELGSGTFGTVYHGKWKGSDVAIKRIKKSCFTGRPSEQERLTTEFWREAEILSKIHHPNVMAFYGVVRDGPGATLATVTEFMVNGSLRHVLQRKDRYIDRRKQLIIAMDAAFGMEYLHSKNIVHFDLKCDNLLVNLKDQSRPICKVGDFGLSKIKRNTLVSGGVRGTLPWMAPELLSGCSNQVSEKVDVFSFGIVMWEILTGEEPYANMHYGAIIGGIVNNTLRPPVPASCDKDWRTLMEQCWAPDPLQRPAFTQVASRLRAMSAAASQAKHVK